MELWGGLAGDISSGPTIPVAPPRRLGGVRFPSSLPFAFIIHHLLLLPLPSLRIGVGGTSSMFVASFFVCVISMGREVVEIDPLERRLLTSNGDNDVDGGLILYNASFDEMEDNYVKYQTTKWVLYSLLLILARGIGLLMLLYLPILRYIPRQDFRSRKLYVTPDAIIYEVTRPVLFPCFGVLKKEKHILLPSVADIVVEQGYLQSFFGIHSSRIENVGVRKLASEDVQIQGAAHPSDFRKAVLMHLSRMSGQNLSQQAVINEDASTSGSGFPPGTWMSPRSSKSGVLPYFGELILEKLDEVGSSLKLVDNQYIRSFCFCFEEESAVITREAGSIIRNFGLRKGDRRSERLTFWFMGGLEGNMHVDLTGVSPLVSLGSGAFTVGHAALKTASAKVVKHEKACADNQHAFIPFTFDTFGFLALDAVEFLERVQKVMHNNVMIPKSMDVVFKRIGFAIEKGLAAQLVARLPSFSMS